jgi:hypothetical protein
MLPSRYRSAYIGLLACMSFIGAARLVGDHEWAEATAAAGFGVFLLWLARHWWNIDNCSVTGRGKDRDQDKQNAT